MPPAGQGGKRVPEKVHRLLDRLVVRGTRGRELFSRVIVRELRERSQLLPPLLVEVGNELLAQGSRVEGHGGELGRGRRRVRLSLAGSGRCPVEALQIVAWVGIVGGLTANFLGVRERRSAVPHRSFL